MVPIPVCRICYEGAEPHKQLVHPCNCKGTIKFVHKQCLREWLRVSTLLQCELCNTTYDMEEVQLEPLYEPPLYLLRICIYPHVLFLNLMCLYVGYLLYDPTEPYYGLMGFTLWKIFEFYKLITNLLQTLPYLLLCVATVQGVILVPALSVLHNKYRYLTYCCSLSHIPTMRLSVPVYCIFLVGGFVISFYFSIVGSFLVLVFLSKLYVIHSQLILKINTTIMKDAVLDMFQ